MPYKCEWKLPAGTFPFIYFNWNMYLSKTLWWRVKQVVRGRDYIHLIIIGTKNSKMQKTYLILGCIVVEISLLSYRTIFRTSFHFRLQIEKKYLEKNKRKIIDATEVNTYLVDLCFRKQSNKDLPIFLLSVSVNKTSHDYFFSMRFSRVDHGAWVVYVDIWEICVNQYICTYFDIIFWTIICQQSYFLCVVYK